MRHTLDGWLILCVYNIPVCASIHALLGYVFIGPCFLTFHDFHSDARLCFISIRQLMFDGTNALIIQYTAWWDTSLVLPYYDFTNTAQTLTQPCPSAGYDETGIAPYGTAIARCGNCVAGCVYMRIYGEGCFTVHNISEL